MGFVEAVKSVYSNYANFKGRASRSEYWWFFLFFMIIYFGLAAISGAFTSSAPSGIGGILLGIFYIGSIIPSIAVAVRRMHDSDKSGWFMLIPFYSLYLAIIKGTDGPNRFGEDPVGGVGDTFD